MAEKVLGIDVGGNSLGWALISINDDGKPAELRDAGVCIFLSAEEQGEAKNKHRRDKRLARRQLDRRTQRRNLLSRALINAGLLPEDERERRRLLRDGSDSDSYELRARALDEKLEPHQIGRILMHMVRRRGFLSSRKQNLGDLVRDPEVQKIIKKLEAEDAERMATKTKQSSKRGKEKVSDSATTTQNDEKDEGEILKGIKTLEEEMREEEARTIGEYFSKLHEKRKPVRRRHTSRDMYEEEFNAIWEKQSEYHPSILTKELRERIHHIIFYQRPIKLDPDRFGKCPYEPEENRAYSALPSVQRWRIWQDLNNLTHRQKNLHDEIPLTYNEKKNLAKELEEKEKLTWAQVRKLLHLGRDKIFNLEEEKGKKGKELTGNKTAILLRRAIGEKWDNLTEERQDELVKLLISEQDRKALYETLQKEWDFTKEEAIKAISSPLPTGVAGVSLTVVRNTLPHLQSCERCEECNREGHLWHHALKCAGYKFQPESSEALPEEGTGKLPSPPEVRNPVVQKALYQLRKVINAIIRQYGKPDRIRIEFARDLQASRKKKEQIINEQIKNEKANEKAREALKELNIHPSRDNIIKYRLWEEYAYCPYTGKKISKDMLFTEQVDIEHILPLSRTLDDSYMNKTLCLAEENRNKHNKTPWEAYGHDEKRWEEILERIKNLPEPKQDRFKRKELPDDFSNRQLNDARYFARSAREYLQKHIGCPVEPTKGPITAILRDAWGLNELLRKVVKEGPGSPLHEEAPSKEPEDAIKLREETEEEETSTSRSGKTPKLRDDHRHHLVDAVAIALTSPSLIKELSEHSRKQDIPGKRPPWKGFSPLPPEFLKKFEEHLKEVTIYYDPRHKIEGEFHDETAYGMRERVQRDEWKKPENPDPNAHTFVIRKPVEKLTPNEVARILDGGIRERVIDRILELSPEDKRENIKNALKQDENAPEQYEKEGKPKVAADTKKLIENSIKKLSPPTKHDHEGANQGVKDHGGKYIRHVRIEARFQNPQTVPIKNAQGRVYKVYLIQGQYHHVEIFECTQDHADPKDPKKEWKKGNRRGYFVSQLESAERARRRKEPIVSRKPPEEWGPHWKFVMSLHKNDMVELKKPKKEGIFRVQQLEPSSNRVVLRLHTAANTADTRTRAFLTIPDSHHATKITVDPLGKKSPCHD